MVTLPSPSSAIRKIPIRNSARFRIRNSENSARFRIRNSGNSRNSARFRIRNSRISEIHNLEFTRFQTARTAPNRVLKRFGSNRTQVCHRSTTESHFAPSGVRESTALSSWGKQICRLISQPKGLRGQQCSSRKKAEDATSWPRLTQSQSLTVSRVNKTKPKAVVSEYSCFHIAPNTA